MRKIVGLVLALVVSLVGLVAHSSGQPKGPQAHAPTLEEKLSMAKLDDQFNEILAHARTRLVNEGKISKTDRVAWSPRDGVLISQPEEVAPVTTK